MSYADKVFVSMCNDIIENGQDTKGELVRPIWEDTGEKAYTIKRFGVVNRYDLRKEFPALTLRKTAIKSATDEILWIWQKKSNNIKDLSSHIWDEWADESGSIGKAYGYQIGRRYAHHKISINDKDNLNELAEYKNAEVQIDFWDDSNGYKEKTGRYLKPFEILNNDKYYTSIKKESIIESYVLFDQIDAVIWDLKHNPYSRRIMTNIYNFEDLHEMNLYPCAYSMTFNCIKDKDSDKLVLNAVLNQRSQDVLAANNWNVVQYSILLMMIAQSCDMIPGELVHVIADCHIYDRHVPIIKELITREQYPAPKVWLNPDIKNFYDFTKDDVFVENYITGEQIKHIPIAV